MFVQATRFKKELRNLKRMSRAQLIQAIGERADCLPHDLQQRGRAEAMVRLRMILFTARLIQMLRRMPRRVKPGRLRVADLHANKAG